MPKGFLETQLKRADKKLKFEVTFPNDYPFKPLFIRVLVIRVLKQMFHQNYSL